MIKNSGDDASHMKANSTLYRVRFMGQQNKLYELYAHDVYQSDLYGFVVVENLVFGSKSTVVVDPSEEKLKNEFDGVKQTMIPMHAVVRIDEVQSQGVGKIVEFTGNVSQFPASIYTPQGGGDNS